MEDNIKIVGLTPKKKPQISSKLVWATIGLIVLAVGVLAGIYLVKQQQDLREKAAGCVEQCPGTDGVLRNCHPPEADGSSTDSTCSSAFLGRVEFCGTRNYCCNGSSWTTNMSACATSTPTATATTTATATATATTQATATATSASSCNSACTSNSNCASGMVCNITSGATSGTCRNSLCVSDSDCVCTGTATATATSKATSTVKATITPTKTATATARATVATNSGSGQTPVPVPVTGANLPTIVGSVVGFALLIISLALAI